MSGIKLVEVIAIAGLLAIADAGAASAADIGAVPNGKTGGYIVPAYDWSGAYVGFNLGYGFGRTSDTAVLGSPSLSTDTAMFRSTSSR
jgi:hypothetical protein